MTPISITSANGKNKDSYSKRQNKQAEAPAEVELYEQLLANSNSFRGSGLVGYLDYSTIFGPARKCRCRES